ncbi:MAG TPA: UDP-N-acetylmuramoyl-L-alanyl-D-glutamate--2,6-diaminopimelate ligase [Eubacteriales bacterium]|nr:UDP-N-acetylmuramoyl-L-alanyl-D-glutamate--2,6-diaminopimelate ligase [Eubacteriales bacterium]
MLLAELIKGLKNETIGFDNVEISSLACDTANVKKESLFFCIKGGQADGHDFAAKAVFDGAVALVAERKLDIDVTQIIVSDVRAVMALIAKKFYDNAVDKLILIGVVGTNGKTSITYLINSILRQAGHATAVIGTNGVIIGDEKFSTDLTTPDPIELHEWFWKFSELKIKYVVMEVSAHAIYYKKIEGLRFDVTVFTNFSQDHLDFFHNMNAYAETKMSVFNEKYTKVAVVNSDDELGRRIVTENKIPIVTYGYEDVSDIFAMDYVENKDGMEFLINIYDEVERVGFYMHGKFNLYNILAAATTARIFGIKLKTITQGIKNVKRIDGRNETFYMGGKKIVVDFAHTPDGITNILSYLKEASDGKLIVVFGCGGNRDKFKRPLMAMAVSKYANFAVVTDDNPRYENPETIVNEILGGMECQYIVIHSRKNAIEHAIEMAEKGDTVAILGKGAETYQEIMGRKIPFSDYDVLQKYI